MRERAVATGPPSVSVNAVERPCRPSHRDAAWVAASAARGLQRGLFPMEKLPNVPQAELASLWREASASYPSDVSRRRLRDVAKRLSADARAAGLRSEELVVAIKESCAAHHDDVDPSRGHKHLKPLVSELITVCIEEFYRDGQVR